jgi:hypothetical protein
MALSSIARTPCDLSGWRCGADPGRRKLLADPPMIFFTFAMSLSNHPEFALDTQSRLLLCAGSSRRHDVQRAALRRSCMERIPIFSTVPFASPTSMYFRSRKALHQVAAPR